MKILLKEIALALIWGILIPGVILNAAVKLGRHDLDHVDEAELIFYTQPEEDAIQIRVLRDDGTVAILELEEYIIGVVLAEMPASFEVDALKAQAVVARTYTMRAAKGKSKHDDADVCMESTCCQAYRTQADTSEDEAKVQSAVLNTSGEVLTYKGELIEATYFSCSGGSTEDALAVWGTEVPYLVATESPGEEQATHYSDHVSIAPQSFLEALTLESSETPEKWFGTVTYTAGGGVDTMEICGKIFKGTELRKLLNLRSTAITIEPSTDKIIITTRGYGHRVGMSQYGADAMALDGYSYDEILSHYYKGTELTTLSH